MGEILTSLLIAAWSIAGVLLLSLASMGYGMALFDAALEKHGLEGLAKVALWWTVGGGLFAYMAFLVGLLLGTHRGLLLSSLIARIILFAVCARVFTVALRQGINGFPKA